MPFLLNGFSRQEHFQASFNSFFTEEVLDVFLRPLGEFILNALFKLPSSFSPIASKISSLASCTDFLMKSLSAFDSAIVGSPNLVGYNSGELCCWFDSLNHPASQSRCRVSAPSSLSSEVLIPDIAFQWPKVTEGTTRDSQRNLYTFPLPHLLTISSTKNHCLFIDGYLKRDFLLLMKGYVMRGNTRILYPNELYIGPIILLCSRHKWV